MPIRFPLPFVSPNGSMASIPGDGTALHPHIHISTKAPDGPEPGADVPELPVNTICEFTSSMHNNSFGDDFSLNSPELGGPTHGRSHLAERLLRVEAATDAVFASGRSRPGLARS